MRDFAIVLILLFLVWVAWFRPWMGVLGLVMLTCMHPQGYANGLMREFPLYQILFLVVLVSALRDQVKSQCWPSLYWDWRFGVIGLLWGVFLYTTSTGINPWVAWPRMGEVAKILPPLLLVVWLIDSREKLFYLLVTMALSIAAITFKGGFWALMTGFHDRVYGPPRSQIGGNNEFAVAVAMTIPLLVLWLRECRDRRLYWVILIAIVLSYGAALSSWSRGGLLSLTAATLVMLGYAWRRWAAIMALVIGLGVALLLLPADWFARMESIGAHEVDASAQGRLEVWRIGRDFVQLHPYFGGGFEGWIFATLTRGFPMDWHNAYIEMATEHGLIGLALWMSLFVGTLLNLAWLARLGRNRRDPWLTNYSAMLLAALLAYAMGGVFLGIAYWEIAYLLLVCAIVLRRLAGGERDFRWRPAPAKNV